MDDGSIVLTLDPSVNVKIGINCYWNVPFTLVSHYFLKVSCNSRQYSEKTFIHRRKCLWVDCLCSCIPLRGGYIVEKQACQYRSTAKKNNREKKQKKNKTCQFFETSPIFWETGQMAAEDSSPRPTVEDVMKQNWISPHVYEQQQQTTVKACFFLAMMRHYNPFFTFPNSVLEKKSWKLQLISDVTVCPLSFSVTRTWAVLHGCPSVPAWVKALQTGVSKQRPSVATRHPLSWLQPACSLMNHRDVSCCSSIVCFVSNC